TYLLVGASLGDNFFGAIDRLQYGTWVPINTGPSCGVVMPGRKVKPGDSTLTQAIHEGRKPLEPGDYRYRLRYLRHGLPPTVPPAGYPTVRVEDVFEVTQE